MEKKTKKISGGEILLKSLSAHGVDTVFGYPGGSIIPVFDRLYDYTSPEGLRHILVRHEQAAIHAAEGYARVTGKTGCVIVTSGPGATNVITGIADANIDSVPVVVIAGQVGTSQLGSDAFQETDFIGMTGPVTKWNYQIRRAEDVAWAVSRAFYIASSGRPGPVVLDFTKDAQLGLAEYKEVKCDFIRSYVPVPVPDEQQLERVASMIDAAQRPFLVFGQGIITSHAESQLEAFLEKTDIPAGGTLLGLSALATDNPRMKGMLGMHGSIASNIMTQKSDLLIAVGMRFDDRVTGSVSTYAPNARKIHIDIDASEINKIIKVDEGVLGDAAYVLERLTALVHKTSRKEWNEQAAPCDKAEKDMVCLPEIKPEKGSVNPGEVVAVVAEACKGKAIVVTDVGQNQMLAARYSRFNQTRSLVTSGGLGTMGFGLPAAIGAKIGCPERTVCLFVGDGGLQMTIEELGTIMQEQTGVKIILLNNNWLGNVRQWQQLFFHERYSFTRLVNPDFGKIAEAYGITFAKVDTREELMPAIERMLSDDKAFLLEVHVTEKDNVFPMVAPGCSIDEIMLSKEERY